MSSEKKVKCKLFYTYLWDQNENYDAIYSHVIKNYSNWEEITKEELVLLEKYVFEHNSAQKRLTIYNARYLFLVTEPSPGLPASLIPEIIAKCEEKKQKEEEERQKRETDKKIQEENKQKLKLERDKKRLEKLRKKIVEAEKFSG